MNAKKLNNLLQNMKGKPYQYGNQLHIIQGFALDDDKFTITTNQSIYSRKLEAAETFLKYWQPVTGTELSPVNEDQQLAIFVEKEQSKADKLIEILEDNITKVQNDAGYIAQAQAINNNINSIINIQKMKMDVMKQMWQK
jgi:hypothetical protein